MPADILFQVIEYALRTVIFFVLIWLMIKVQRFDRRFHFRLIRVLGAAAFVAGLRLLLHQGLGPYIGFRIAGCLSAPLVFMVFWYAIKRITRADYVETFFTVTVSAVLTFVISLFALGLLTSRLEAAALNFHVPGRPSKPAAVARPVTAAPTNPPAPATGPAAPHPTPVSTKPEVTVKPEPAPQPAPPPPPVAPAAPETNPAPGTAVAPLAPVPVKPPESKYFSIKGVTRNGANSAVTLQAGARSYTIFIGESALVQTPDGPLSVHFSDLAKDSVTLEINGEAKKYPIP